MHRNKGTKKTDSKILKRRWKQRFFNIQKYQNHRIKRGKENKKMSDFEAIETREQFEEAVKDRLEQERETVRREFSGYLSPEAVEEKYKEYLSPKDAEEKYKGYLSPEDAANKDAAIAKYEKESKRVKVAMENGIPYELAGKLSGETEDEMKKDAEAFSKFLKGKTTYPNFTRDTDNKDDSIREATKKMLNNLKGE
jgi:hypothetical protein|nr:MAG TPA: protein of unknown function (DUF4355) [Caudoviricetes sp.]